MDPLSDVLSLLKPQSYVSGGFGVDGDTAISFPSHTGIKCYAILSGQCWLRLETLPEPLLLTAGACFLLPRGLPFSLSTDPTLTPVDYRQFLESKKISPHITADQAGANFLVGGHFALTGAHAAMLLNSLPPVVHLEKESDKAAMRWSLERMKEELRDPQPGGALIAQQLAYMMIVQALRLHLTATGRHNVGWLFALADPQMSAALTALHETPGHPWTLKSLAERASMSRSIFALRFKSTVGLTPMDYLIRWRMNLAADKLRNSAEPISCIASALGYDSESAFSKAFRRIMSASPRQYRQGQTNLPAST